MGFAGDVGIPAAGFQHIVVGHDGVEVFDAVVFEREEGLSAWTSGGDAESEAGGCEPDALRGHEEGLCADETVLAGDWGVGRAGVETSEEVPAEIGRLEDGDEGGHGRGSGERLIGGLAEEATHALEPGGEGCGAGEGSRKRHGVGEARFRGGCDEDERLGEAPVVVEAGRGLEGAECLRGGPGVAKVGGEVGCDVAKAGEDGVPVRCCGIDEYAVHVEEERVGHGCAGGECESVLGPRPS